MKEGKMNDEEKIGRALEKMLDGNRVGFSNIVKGILDEVAAEVINDMRDGLRSGDLELAIEEETLVEGVDYVGSEELEDEVDEDYYGYDEIEDDPIEESEELNISLLDEGAKRTSPNYIGTVKNDEAGNAAISKLRDHARANGAKITIAGRLGKNSPHVQHYKDQAKNFAYPRNPYQRIKKAHASHFDVYSTKPEIHKEGFDISSLMEGAKRTSPNYVATVKNDDSGHAHIRNIRDMVNHHNKNTDGKKLKVEIYGRLGKNSPHASQYKGGVNAPAYKGRRTTNNPYQRIRPEHASHFDVYVGHTR